jgi:FUN14 family
VNDSSQQTNSVFASWFENGPWRSKTVLAALAVFVVGLWFWYSDIRDSPPPNGSGNAATNTTGPAPAGTAGASPADAPSKWSKPFPWYARLSLSYVGGYCIGWLFRKLIRLVMVVFALAIALLAYGKFTGFDFKRTEERVKRGGQWAQHEVTAAEDYFKHLLPSAAAGGVGTFVGFLRRNRTRGTKPEN